MASGAHILPRLPAAPVAEVPEGVTVDGAARTVWRPNVLHWMGMWRLVVACNLAAVLAVDAGIDAAGLLLVGVGGWAVLTSLAAVVRPTLVRSTLARAVDLLVLTALLAIAPTQASFALVALYSASAVIAWAADHPAGAFLAAAILSASYLVTGLSGPYAQDRPAAFVGNLALYFFFALAVSGFFTVARRISALEIATEMSRERGRYRRDLHDRLGQALCGLHFELQALQAGGADEDAGERFGSLADGYGAARGMLEDLFADADEPLMATNVGLLLHQETRRLADQTGATITSTVEGEANRIPPWMRPHVWSIAGECMTNALKNGQAGNIEVDLVVESGVLVLTVSDDGVGFDMPDGELPDKHGHYGLREMQERARLCGGEVAVASQPGFGTRVRLRVPLPEDGTTDSIIDRDASALRANTWSLISWLRAGLGIVALTQLAASIIGGGDHRGVLAVVGVVMVAELVGSIALFGGSAGVRLVRPWTLAASMAVYLALLIVALLTDTPPYALLYAPLVLLQAGVAFGRHAAAGATAAFAAVATAIVALSGSLGDVATEPSASIAYVTNVIIIGLCATQGAKLLDRLEALQIRVRFQALALIRQSLTSRMRDDLIAVLDDLEARSRELVTAPPASQGFQQQTEPLMDGSNTLKRRLREIVHQLAEPEQGRT